jgi:hypothetical protein
LIAKGMTEEQACLRVGINHSSLRTAKHRNPEFETAIKKGQADFLDEALDMIAKGGRGWQGLAWILERRHGDQFRRNSSIEVAGHLATFSTVDYLARKPIPTWTLADLEQSVGAWKLVEKFSQEQLELLLDLYMRCWWGEPREMTTEQLKWILEVERRLSDFESNEATELLVESPEAPLQLTVAGT